MTDYSELKRLAEAATPGRNFDRLPMAGGGLKYECTGDDGSLVLKVDHKNDEWGFVGDNGQADEEFFLACAPAVVLALIVENERLVRRDQMLAEVGCEYCGGSGHVSRVDGEYLGVCDQCPSYELNCTKLERDQLKAENEALRKGIDPAWSLMDQSILIDHLRLNTNFTADKFDAMIQFAVECAQYVELHPAQGEQPSG